MIETISRLRALLEGVCEETLSYRPSPDVFSLRENVMHLRDVDVEAYEKRIVAITTESHPFLANFEGPHSYDPEPLDAVLEALAASRARSIERLRDADLTRTAEFEGIGAITLAQLLEMWAKHDAGHLADIEALLAGRAARKVADAA